MSPRSLFLTVLLLSSQFLVSISFIIFKAFFIELSLAEYYVGSPSPLAASFVIRWSNVAIARTFEAFFLPREELHCRCGVGQIPI